ncbi:hypothetical protein KCU91_g11522, partial [Aureobasidium melanogenum]
MFKKITLLRRCIGVALDLVPIAILIGVEALKLLDELDDNVDGLFKDELRAAIEDVVEVTVLVTVPGAGDEEKLLEITDNSVEVLITEDKKELLLDDVDEAGLLLDATDGVPELLTSKEDERLLLDNAEEDKLLLEEVILDVVTFIGAAVVVAVLLDDAKEDGMLLERLMPLNVDVVTVVGVVAIIGLVAVVGVAAIVGLVAVIRAELSKEELLGIMLLDTDRLGVAILEADEDARLDKLETATEEMAAREDTDDGTLGPFEDDKEELTFGEGLPEKDDGMRELDAAAEAVFAEKYGSDDIDDTLELLEDDTLEKKELAEDDRELLKVEEELLGDGDDVEAVTEASSAENDKPGNIDDETLELLEDDALELDEDDRPELTELEEEELLDRVAEARLAETPWAYDAEDDIKDETPEPLEELKDDRLELIEELRLLETEELEDEDEKLLSDEADAAAAPAKDEFDEATLELLDEEALELLLLDTDEEDDDEAELTMLEEMDAVV